MNDIKIRIYDKIDMLISQGLSLNDLFKRDYEWEFNDGSTLSPNDFIFYYNDFELTQYIGIKDINGKEVYDEDIVNVKLFDWDTEIMVAKWSNKKHGFKFFDSEGVGWSVSNTEFEIIGNTMMNPELVAGWADKEGWK